MTATANDQCLECGGPIETPMPDKEFCTRRCRQTFKNCRLRRSAQVYDLYMATRYERDAARVAKVQAQLNRLCMHFREEDDQRRGGRRSWGNWRKFMDDNPCLRVIRLGRMLGGRMSGATRRWRFRAFNRSFQRHPTTYTGIG